MKEPPSSDTQPPIPLSDELRKRAWKKKELEQETGPTSKSWEERQRAFALKVWAESRHIVTTKQQFAREQTMVDWLEVPLPINETKGIQSVENVLVQLLSELKISTHNIQTENLSEGWKRAAGDFIAANAQLISIEKETAVIKVLQPTLRYHLNQMKAPLLEKLQNEFSTIRIRQLRFLYG